MSYFVYVLRSLKNGRFYTGSTQNLEKRLEQHQTGQSQATRYVRPFELVFSEVYATRPEAIRREKELKTGRGREEARMRSEIIKGL